MFFETEQLTKRNRAHLYAASVVDNFNFELAAKQYTLFTDAEIVEAARKRERLLFDVESFANYFLVAFKSYDSGKVVYFEDSPESCIDRAKLNWIIRNFCCIGFNSGSYDVPAIIYALCGHRCAELKQFTNDVITGGMHIKQVQQTFKIEIPTLDHIDLINVAPLQASLKLYGGRLHAPRLQDTPFDPNKMLTQAESQIVKHYCINDLDTTGLLFKELEPQIKLRERMSVEHNQDLRSRSDAQVAEAVLSSELAKVKGWYSKPPKIEPGTSYNYIVPQFISYKLPVLQHVLETIRNAKFTVSDYGNVEMPPALNELAIPIGNGVYRMGIGGLHSSEKCVAHRADADTLIVDRDVASYYPAIILNCELYPKHLGKAFLEVYRGIVNRRLEAKRIAPKGPVEQSLKITINGSFGKLGNKYSVLYSPDLMIQVTVTGQLSLLMLIEMLEGAGIPVISANTDGVVIKCPKSRYRDLELWIIYWQQLTGFETEETKYSAIYCRDVNNYFAIKEDGSCKVKGCYTERGSALNSVLSKNPENQICNDAVTAFLTKRVPVEDTIRKCSDIRRFVTVRNVKGGAEKNGVFLGRVVRYYYSTKIRGEINYITNGNKVPNSDNAMPLMELPAQFPADVDYDRYVRMAKDILYEVGYYGSEIVMPKLF